MEASRAIRQAEVGAARTMIECVHDRFVLKPKQLAADHDIIVDVDASRSNKSAEVGAMRKMIDRTHERFGLKPDWVATDTAYGASETQARIVSLKGGINLIEKQLL